MTWTYDAESHLVAHSEGRTQFSHDELSRTVWPPCPVCGTPLDVQVIPTPDLSTTELGAITGRIECLRGCDLRKR